MELDEETLNRVYTWVDEVPLSRPKKNLGRDFSDAAEVIAHYYPKIVDLHNYNAVNSVTQKVYNWNTLNQKVLKKFGMQLSKDEINSIVSVTPMAIERFLADLQIKLSDYKQRQQAVKNKNKERYETPPKQPGQIKRREKHPISNRYDDDSEEYRDDGYIPQNHPYKQQQQPQQQQIIPNRRELDVEAMKEIDMEILTDKEIELQECKEANEIMAEKIRKLESLVKIKDEQIKKLTQKLRSANLI